MSDEQTPFGAPGDVPAEEDTKTGDILSDVTEAAAEEASAEDGAEQDSTVEEILIEAGDALVAALAGGNTGVSQNALDGWEAAKSQALAAVVESVEVEDSPSDLGYFGPS